MTPTVLLYDRPASALEGKFSLPFCAAAAVVDGAIDLDTFDAARLHDPRVAAVQSRVTMTVDPRLDQHAPALTQTRVTVRLKDGRVLTAAANGARGYPANPASDDELATKFLSCARRAMPDDEARRALEAVRDIEHVRDIREITSMLATRQA
jgi:2-methylcitrate dehydratase PrpD